MRRKTKSVLQIIALFCIYLIVNISVVHALAITHDPASDASTTQDGAAIRWTTDEPADSKVDYGSSTGLGSSESDSGLATQHSITLTGLGAAAAYYYKLTSSTAGETATADNSGSLYSFTTQSAGAGNAPPQFNVSLPEYYNRRQITFGGYTDPDSVIRLYLNANQADIGTDRYDQLTTSDGSGHFVFKYINLPQSENTLAIWARDPSGNVNTATYTVKVDTDDPVVSITKPAPLISSTSFNLNGTVNEDVALAHSVNGQQGTQQIAAGSFNVQLTLKEGIKNQIGLQFSDKAGNVYETKYTIDVDTKGPTITWTNLGALDPSYIQEIDVEGNVSKPGATVVVFLNNKTYSSESWSTSVRDMLVHYGSILAEGDREYATKADKSGHFKIRVFLTQEIVSTKSEYQQDPYRTSPTTGVGAPGGAPTTFSTSQAIAPRITSGSTGRFSNAWDNKIIVVAFDELGRADKRDGVITFARCGYGADWNILIKDPTPSVIIPEHLRQGIAQVSFAVNLEWQGAGTKQKLLREPVITQYKLSEEMKKNYVFDPNQLISGIHPLWSPDRKRGYVVVELHKKDYEQKNLSHLKKEDLFIKLPLQIQLEYQYDDGSGNIVTGIQKQCWDVSTILDIRIPPSVIPRELLNASVIFLNSTISAINKILKPLKAITIAVFVTCLLSWVIYFFALMKKAYDCMDSKDKKEPSDACKESTKHAKDVEKYMHYVCDRIFCPTVPTADYYFQKMSPTDTCKASGLTPEMSKDDQKCGQEYMDQWDSACLLMNELERSKCIRAQEGDTRFSQSCSESGQMLKNLWYGASDFCRKKGEPQARRIAITKGKETEEWVIDEQGRVHKVESTVKTEEVRREGGELISPAQGSVSSTYTFGPLGTYTSKEGGDLSSKIDYDAEGRYYYPSGAKEADRTYLCYDKDGKLMSMPKSREGKLYHESCKGGGPATLPPEIMKAANLPSSRKDIVDPADNLLTALQCVCLPSINGFLTMWRNMLGAIMQCFQSILVTGDGKSGLCREVLTVYICDVIFSAIRCFVNKFGGGASKRSSETSSISSFFRSAATAGGDIEKSITGRYGESALYKTMFSERKLINAACLWAFTGDFDFDIGSELTAPGAIPLNSKAFMYPRTRRFMGSNPLTGYTTHIYNIGVGIVAGADMSFKLELVCSQDDSCSIQEGFPSGFCDCYHVKAEKTRDITYSMGTSSLLAGDMLGPNEGNLYLKIENEKYRFDKVRLTYTYTDNKGQRKTEIKEEKISQIGGKPPADCSFDLAGGVFRCAYEIGDMGYAIFVQPPVPDKKVYGLGDYINLNFKIDKKSPQKPEGQAFTPYDQVPFYLKYVVKSPSGEDTNVQPIAADGVQDFTGRYPNVEVTESLLTGKAAVQLFEVSDLPPKEGVKISPDSYDAKGAKFLSFAVYVSETSAKNAKIEDRTFKVKVCGGDMVDVEKRGETKKEFRQDDRSCVMASGIEGSEGGFAFETLPYPQKVKITHNGMIIYVSYGTIARVPSGKMGGFIMAYKPPEQQSASLECRTQFIPGREAPITIKIGLYPCMKKDESQPMSLSNCDVDPTPVNYFGDVQEHEITAKAVCSAGSGSDAPVQCDMGKYLNNECECRKEMVGRNNCGKEKSNYCYFAIDEYKCVEYMSCKASTPDKLEKIENTATGTLIGEERIGEEKYGRYYCDCEGYGMMKDCTGKYCYAKGGDWDCYPNPPAAG